MTIQDIKKEYNLKNEDIADMFGFKNVISYQNSSAKKRYENGLIAFNKVVMNCNCKELSNLNDSIIGIDNCIKCDKPIDR